VSKKRGLPQQARMRHDSHFVEALSERFGASLGRWIPVEEIDTNPDQPRTNVGDLSELVRSIEAKGILEPLLVRPGADGRCTIIAGERRYRAAIEAGLTEVPCIELEVTDPEMLELALIENLHRKDLHPFEEAEGYATLARAPSYTQQKIADAVGKSRVSITEALSLLEIPEDLREKCRRADIEARSVLLEIAKLGDRDAMEDAIDRVSGGETRDDLRATKKQEKGEGRKARHFQFVWRPKGAPFKLNLSFSKARVDKAELIDTLRDVLRKLETGEIRVSRGR
jgi:ParB family transcriptional regulator, chromosome partitioning protein